MSRCSLVSAAFAAALLAPAAASAQQQQGPAQVPGLPGADKMEEREGHKKPLARDLRTGHVYIDAITSAAFAVGNLAPGAALSDVAAYGITGGGALGVGLSRHVELDARGSYGVFAPPGDCKSCSSNVASANLGFTYHLTQGASFDPWIRLGAGYRTFSLEHGTDEASRILQIDNGRYHGIDIASLALGADFFPVPGFGFGPWFEANMGTFVAWPDGSPVGTRAYGFLLVGLEIELDPVQWVGPAAASPSPRPAPGTPTPAPSAPAKKADVDAPARF